MGVFLAGITACSFFLFYIATTLPDVIGAKEYKPSLVSEVYDRNKEKFGEFFQQKRKLIPFENIPEIVKQAFVSSEDSTFFKHKGVNFRAISRAFFANIKAGRKAQGGSTITQQVVKSLYLTREKTYVRKIKEIFLAYEMEKKLSKADILYIYLNQVYLGHGSYGIVAASEIYFRKPVAYMSLAEVSLIAGLPQAPSRYSPLYNPMLAKARQKYVLRRMVQEGYVTDAAAEEAFDTPIKVYKRKNFDKAGFFLETVRQVLVKKIGEKTLLTEGVKVYTSLDLKKQMAAEEAVKKGLRELDKRQGFRRPKQNLLEFESIADFLYKNKKKLIDQKKSWKMLSPDGTIDEISPLDLNPSDENFPEYVVAGDVVDGVVTEVNDETGLVYVRFAETRGIIDISTMKWARKPNAQVYYHKDEIENPSQALKKGDIIEVKVVSEEFKSSRISQKVRKLRRSKTTIFNSDLLKSFKKYAGLELEQSPQVEGALLSFDLDSQEVLAMVGGYDFKESKFNRSLQAIRQTGSAFKAIVYTAALDKGLNPSSKITDAPLVYEEKKEPVEESLEKPDDSGQVTKWRPENHSKNFLGDILLRTALIRSLNVPTIKVIEKIGIDWVASYAKRLGMFNRLNKDLSMALGSSSVTVYEVNKVFSHLARLGKQMSPVIIHEVIDQEDNVIAKGIGLDERFQKKISAVEKTFDFQRENYLKMRRYIKSFTHEESGIIKIDKTAELENTVETKEDKLSDDPPTKDMFFISSDDGKKIDLRKLPPIFFNNPNQLIKKTTAYIITSLLKAAVFERNGTGARARALRRPVAGKTGSTSGYFDGWFAGYTPNISTTVWVGYDKEKSLGKGEVGGRNALPIWLNYMKEAHRGILKTDFKIPEGIVFSNIDLENGYLATAASKETVRQAYEEGSEPQKRNESPDEDSESDFLKNELSE